jgi:hypothetical protein
MVSPLSDSEVMLLCAGQGAAGSSQKALYRSLDAGRSWIAAGPPQFSGGDGGKVSAATAAVIAVATSSGASEVYRSTNGGDTWSTAFQVADGGIGWGDFGFTDQTQGLLIHAPGGRLQGPASQGQPFPATLFLTTDGGATWKPVTF